MHNVFIIIGTCYLFVFQHLFQSNIFSEIIQPLCLITEGFSPPKFYF